MAFVIFSKYWLTQSTLTIWTKISKNTDVAIDGSSGVQRTRGGPVSVFDTEVGNDQRKCTEVDQRMTSTISWNPKFDSLGLIARLAPSNWRWKYAANKGKPAETPQNGPWKFLGLAPGARYTRETGTLKCGSSFPLREASSRLPYHG